MNYTESRATYSAVFEVLVIIGDGYQKILDGDVRRTNVEMHTSHKECRHEHPGSKDEKKSNDLFSEFVRVPIRGYRSAHTAVWHQSCAHLTSARLVQGERNLRLRLPVPTHTGNI